MFSKIVFGIDGSNPSLNALRIACDVAGKYGSQLHIAHTPKPETVAFVMGAVAGYHAVVDMPKPGEIQKVAEEVIAKGVEVAKSCGTDSIVTKIGDGDPGANIVKYADEVGADLIVTGRRGLGDVAGLFLGSTSHDISKYAKCACLSVA